MKIRFFKLPAIKPFTYVPRYYKETEERNGFRIPKHQLRAHSFRKLWESSRQKHQSAKRKSPNYSLWLIFLVLLFITFYLFDFDISFFFRK